MPVLYIGLDEVPLSAVLNVTVLSRGPVNCCCWSQDLKQSPWRHHFGSFVVSLPS